MEGIREGKKVRQRVLAYLGKSAPLRWDEVEVELREPDSDVSRGVEIFRTSAPFVVMDIETTGFSPERDKIIEVAIGKYRVVNGVLEEGDMLNRFVDPGKPIPPIITELTRISNEDVTGKPAIEEIIDEISEFIGDVPVIGHNVGFDRRFLNVDLSGNGCPTLDEDRLTADHEGSTLIFLVAFDQ